MPCSVIAKNAELVDRAKAVFQSTQRSVPTAGRAVEHDEAIDHVLEHLGAGEITFLGDVPDKNHHDIALLGQPREKSGGLTNLRNAARHAVHGLQLHDLNRIEHHDLWRACANEIRDRLSPRFRGDPQIVHRQLQPLGTQRKLMQRLFTADIENFLLLGKTAGNLQQQGALARTRVAAHQHHGPRHQTTTQHAIKLSEAGLQAFSLLAFDLGEPARFALAAGIAEACLGLLDRTNTDARQGVPRTAGRTLALPLGMVSAAVATDVCSSGLAPGHQSKGAKSA